MKKTFTPIISGLLLGSLLLQNCATIISTPSQTVRVVGQPEGSKFFINDKEVKAKPIAGVPGGVTVRVKRKKNAEIKVKHEGYKDYSELLYPDKSNGTVWLNWLPVIGWMGASVTDLDSNTGEEQGLDKVPGIGYGWLVGIGGWLIDNGTGASKRLNKKEVQSTLIRLPAAVAGGQSVQSGPINIRIKGGDKLGNFFIKKEPSEILYFGKTLDFDADHLKGSVNTVLKDLGYAVPTSEGHSVFSTGSSSRYTVQGEMRDIKYDVHASHQYEYRARYETHCNVEVTWKLVNQNRQAVFELKTTGKSIKFEKGGSAAFEDAFENSLYTFLDNKEVMNALAKPAAGSGTAAAKAADNDKLTPIQIHRVALPKAVDNGITLAAKSVVTVMTSDGHGSGCIISGDGYIVTNAHVVGEEETVKVLLADGVEVKGKVVRVNPDMDLALIKVDTDGLNAFQLPSANAAEIGADVFAIGTPADKELGQSISKGIISGRRKIDGHALLQTDVSINGGNSGGALVGRSGQLLGIVNAKLVGRGIEGIGFAIPAEQVTEALQLKFID
jgi:hypothetical protein